MSRRRLGVFTSLFAVWLAAGAAAWAADAWSRLESLRSALQDRPIAADFHQEYVPAGFSTGEREAGTLALGLPACMRFDYREPYQRSYLLCDDQAYTWNEGESQGRRFAVDREEEPGLDLLLLSVDRLRLRYRADLLPGDDTDSVRLHALDGAVGAFAEARLELAEGSLLPTQIEYRDREGNLTRFEIGEQRRLEIPDRFQAPDISWQQ